MEQNTYDRKYNEELVKKYSELQLGDFEQIKKMFEEFVFNFGDWDGIIARLSDVLDKCDEINYEERETAFAYAIWHFLDRYHRFQMLIGELWKRGYLGYKKGRTIDILEVGSGPAQGLFAFSDHYDALNQLEGKKVYSIQIDYVEQSNGFRDFLHHFVEYAMVNEKHYSVPFHFGRAKNAFKFPFEEIRYNWLGDVFKEKYRCDIVVISNFLTTQSTVEKFKEQLIDICKYMRNWGVLIIVGAGEQSDKYKNIYSEVDKIVNRKFYNRNFCGWWNKVLDETFTYNYTDEYGERLREYYCTLKKFITSKGLWDSVPTRAKENLMGKIEQTTERTLHEKWDGIKWKVVVYQKHSFYRGNSNKKIIKKQDERGREIAI